MCLPASPVKAAQDLAQCLLLEAEQINENEGRGAFYSEAGHLLKHILRDNDGAYQAYSKADNVSLLDADSLRQFADVCAKKGEYFLSAELLERWARSLTPPQVISALIDVALFEVSQLNRTDRAISLLQQALDLQPENWNVLHTLRHLLETDEDWNQAATVYEKMGDLSSVNCLQLLSRSCPIQEEQNVTEASTSPIGLRSQSQRHRGFHCL